MRMVLLLSLFLLLPAACNRTKTTPVKNQHVEETPSGENISRIAGILDHYDEVFKVVSDFHLDVFVDGAVAKSSSGRHEYSRGEEKWFYLQDGEVVKTVECYVDRAVVRIPPSKQPQPKGKGKKGKAESAPQTDVVAEYQAKYPCAIQALVRYNAELKGNKLEHDGKMYVVNAVDEQARTVTKVSLHKGNEVQVYTFSNIRFEEPPAEEPAAEEPAADAGPAANPAEPAANPAEPAKDKPASGKAPK